MSNIGVIGMGFVGKAIFHGFSLFHNTKGFDVDSSKSPHTLQETLQSDYIFVCLPTPESDSGDADLSYIWDFFSKIENSNSIFILKSTVPVGTTKKIEEKFNVRIVHNPEFLSARTADIDFLTQSRLILGSNDDNVSDKVANLFVKRFPGINVVKMKSDESELVKYFLNCFFATKITFFNEMRLLSDKLGLSWENIMSGVLSDGRIEKLHTDVPGHDGKFGFGGACFPKDTSALSKIFEKVGIKPYVLDATIKQNKIIRDGN